MAADLRRGRLTPLGWAGLAVGAAIITESVLSFLGLGLREPVESWGVLLFAAQSIRSVDQAGLDACLKLGADIIVNTDGDNQYPPMTGVI